MSSVKQRRGLRTKTGCFTCRSRRKKCDEKTPVCGLCSLSGRQCQWPTTVDLLDRRSASHPQSRHTNSTGDSPLSLSDSDEVDHEVITPDFHHTVALRLCLRSESAAHRGLTQDLEVAISRHFVETYYNLLLLPNCHPDFYHGWIAEIQQLMVPHRSLYYSVLANGASHLYNKDNSKQMQELALTYYSNALRDLSNLLSRSEQFENHNGLLMSVILLYLHGCMGRGTYTDIPRHINAAIRILTLRLFNSPLIVCGLFDRLAVESVLYQMFLVSTGLWSENIALDYDFDSQFWLQAEQFLNRTVNFPGCSTSLNSPVLGLPVSFFRLAISLRQQYQNLGNHDPEVVESLKAEVEEWEAVVLLNRKLDCFGADEQCNPKHQYYQDGSYLYILVISLLSEQLFSTDVVQDGVPQPVSSDSWQVRRAISILQKYEGSEDWMMCFIANWTIYTLGFFVATSDDLELIRAEMCGRWNLTKFAPMARFSTDLEKTWVRRGFNKIIMH